MMSSLSDMGFQKKVIVFYLNNTKDFPVLTKSFDIIDKYKQCKFDQVLISLNASISLWRETFISCPDLEQNTCFVDHENDKIHCSVYDFKLSSQLALLSDVVGLKDKRDSIYKLAEFLTLALPFAKQGSFWLKTLKPGETLDNEDIFSRHLRSYESNCEREGLTLLERYLRLKYIGIQEIKAITSSRAKEFADYIVKRSNFDFLKGREIRHIVYNVNGVYCAESVLIRVDGSYARTKQLMPGILDFRRFDSFVYLITDPELFVLTEPIRWDYMERCGLKPYDYGQLSRKTNIPIVVDGYFMVVLLKHGYVRSTCDIGCSCCYVYDNLIACEKGKECVKGSLIYMSLVFLEQYLSNFNRLHHKEHLLFVLSDLFEHESCALFE